MSTRAPIVGLAVAAALTVLMAVLWWDARTDRRPVVAPPAVVTWTPRPVPPRPVEPRAGAWCADRCRNGHVMDKP